MIDLVADVHVKDGLGTREIHRCDQQQRQGRHAGTDPQRHRERDEGFS